MVFIAHLFFYVLYEPKTADSSLLKLKNILILKVIIYELWWKVLLICVVFGMFCDRSIDEEYRSVYWYEIWLNQSLNNKLSFVRSLARSLTRLHFVLTPEYCESNQLACASRLSLSSSIDIARFQKRCKRFVHSSYPLLLFSSRISSNRSRVCLLLFLLFLLSMLLLLLIFEFDFDFEQLS